MLSFELSVIDNVFGIAVIMLLLLLIAGSRRAFHKPDIDGCAYRENKTQRIKYPA